MNDSLTQPFTSSEVFNALKTINPDKSPGSDGMSAMFYHQYWPIVGDVVTKVALGVLNDGHTIAINRVLDIYHKASGQLLNTSKSVMSFSPNTTQAAKNFFHQILGMPISECHERYLGLPAFSERDKKEMFSDIKERIWQRLHAWNEKLFSVGGKEVLLKAVVQSIPTYAMSYFRLPATFCNQLESMMANFWWGSNKDGSKIHWRSWKLLCKSKFEGGMGFRSFVHFNQALLAKQAWRIFQMPNFLLSRLLKHRYFSNNTFLEARLGHSPSLTWQGIHWGRQLLEEGLRFKIGNGHNVLAGVDKWIPSYFNFKPVSYIGPNNVPVSSFITDHREWNLPMLNQYFQPIDVDKIVAIPLSFFPSHDRYIWHHTTTGLYTVNSGFHLAENLAENRESSGSNTHRDWWKTFWGLSLPSKVKIFSWRVMQNALPVATALCRRKVINYATCSLCSNAWESIGHAMFNCTKAKKVWRETKFKIDHNHAHNMHNGDYLIHLSSIHSKHDFELIICTMWAIWHERNKVTHGGVPRSSLTIATFASTHLEKYARSRSKIWPLSSCTNQRASTSTAVHVDHQHSDRIFKAFPWTPPPDCGLKLNVDVAVNTDLKILGCGAIVRDHHGNVIVALSKPVQGCFQFDEMEAKSLFHSLNWVLQLQLPITHIETDALRVSSAINIVSRDLSSFTDLIVDISCLLSFFSRVTVSHVKRQANQAAHGLAKYALEVDEDVCWMVEIPNLIFSIIVNDYQL
uniref:Reverse transcriptase zinc-binding domain-containing protein n=1 Tax=Cannabis sativa TaxID=3483 RepID=A0A803QJM9_CANSA